MEDQPLVVAEETADTPELAALHDARIAFNHDGYDPADCFTPPVADLDAPGMHFRVGRVAGRAVAMVALKERGEGWGEVKALYVDPAARGRGVAHAMMAAIEEAGREAGLDTLRLETGNLHEGALALYRRSGWAEIERFDPYPANETSIFFEKRL